jgi:hypothetical protein
MSLPGRVLKIKKEQAALPSVRGEIAASIDALARRNEARVERTEHPTIDTSPTKGYRLSPLEV